MNAVEYGKENTRVIMLLHGGGLSWWNYRAEAETLKERCRVVLPILDGHSGSDTPFSTIENNAAELIAYIDEHFGGHIYALCGLSLGAQIAAEMLSKRRDLCSFAVIESALVFPMRATEALIGPSLNISYGLIKKRWFSRLQFKSLKIQESLFDDYFRDSRMITKQNMIRFLKANSSYLVKPTIANTAARVLILAGGRERKIVLRSAEKLYEAIPSSTLKVLEGYSHGELSLNHPQEYVKLLTSFI